MDGGPGRRPGRPDTREEILGSARTLFAERGYGGTSVRAIAKAARVDPAMINHFFGSKEGLLREAVAIPINPLELIGVIASNSPQDIPRIVTQTFLDIWESPETGPAMATFLRTLLANEELSELIRTFLTTTVLPTAANQVLPGVPHSEAQLRINLAMSQLLGVAIARNLIGAAPIASMSRDQLEDTISPTISRYLYGNLAPDEKGSTV